MDTNRDYGALGSMSARVDEEASGLAPIAETLAPARWEEGERKC
jgi:hypothetical protein